MSRWKASWNGNSAWHCTLQSMMTAQSCNLFQKMQDKLLPQWWTSREETLAILYNTQIYSEATTFKLLCRYKITVNPGCCKPQCSKFLDITNILNFSVLPPLKCIYLWIPCKEDVMVVNLDITNSQCRLSINWNCVTWNLAETYENFMTAKHNCHARNVYNRNERMKVTKHSASARLLPLHSERSSLCSFRFCSITLSDRTIVHVQYEHKTTGHSKESAE